MRVIATQTKEQGWLPMIHQCGVYRPLAPTVLPICGSEQEAMERIRIKAGSSQEFRERFHGWWGVALRFDNGLLIQADSAKMEF